MYVDSVSKCVHVVWLLPANEGHTERSCWLAHAARCSRAGRIGQGQGNVVVGVDTWGWAESHVSSLLRELHLP